jgi:hypothetical protein
VIIPGNPVSFFSMIKLYRRTFFLIYWNTECTKNYDRGFSVENLKGCKDLLWSFYLGRKKELEEWGKGEGKKSRKPEVPPDPRPFIDRVRVVLEELGAVTDEEVTVSIRLLL